MIQRSSVFHTETCPNGQRAEHETVLWALSQGDLALDKVLNL